MFPTTASQPAAARWCELTTSGITMTNPFRSHDAVCQVASGSGPGRFLIRPGGVVARGHGTGPTRLEMHRLNPQERHGSPVARPRGEAEPRTCAGGWGAGRDEDPAQT